MNPIIKKDILNTIRLTIQVIKKGDLFRLREASDHVVKNASVFQDKDSITIAVTIYALSKIYTEAKDVDSFVLPHLENAMSALEEGNINNYESEIKHIIKDIEKKNGRTKFYIQEVLERAQIKKASKMYEHGISMGLVAEALGVSLWDLMDYVGKTRIVDKFDFKSNIRERIEYTRGLFSK